MTGLELRLRRTAARVTVTDLANAMQVSPSRVSQIESRDRVTADAQGKYLRALATLETVPPTAVVTEVLA